jgi:hypothetical protein
VTRGSRSWHGQKEKKHSKIKGGGTVAASRHCLHNGSGGTRKIARVPDFQQAPDLPPRLPARPRLSTPERDSRHCREEADLGLRSYPVRRRTASAGVGGIFRIGAYKSAIQANSEHPAAKTRWTRR